MYRLIRVVLAAGLATSGGHWSQVDPDALANDNRTPAGVRSGDTLVLRLVAARATWRINGDRDPGFSTLVFGEEGKSPSVPGPLIRVRTGAPVFAIVRNTLRDTLIVQGLGPRGDGTLDSLRVPPGESGEVRFEAGKPGTYLYRGYTSQQMPPGVPPRFRQAAGLTSQLAGAFIVDSADPIAPDRVMVLTTLVDPPAAGPPTRDRHGVPQREFAAINGKAWPHSERLTYSLGDSIRWRIINASIMPHPMHLHGFYFRVDARGSSFLTDVDTMLTADNRPMVVTEVVPPGGSRAIVWKPDRPGGWLFHCHLTIHMAAMPPVQHRDSVDFPSHHHGDPDRHTENGMYGLLTAITVTGSAPQENAWRPTKRLKLFIQSDSSAADSSRRFGYVLAGDREPRPDSVQYPGPVLVLTRGEPTTIEVVNRTREASAVHWHGLEIDSYFDGAVGWSGTPGVNGRTQPAIRPRQSFEVRLTPQRAGTFMYHTHFDEIRQQFGGLVGGIVVLEPGERWDPTRDLLLLVTDGVPQRAYINGSLDPAPINLTVGERYRIRLADIAVMHIGAVFRLMRSGSPTTWKPLAKDGFALRDNRVAPRPALTRLASGETADFEFVPDQPGELELVLTLGLPPNPTRVLATQRFVVSR
ncbi:MAG: multicopper oxidase domain-containing protein [Gemmatimonadota bacterium]